MPSIVACIWSAPASHAASAFASAKPMSLCTCTSSGTDTSLRTRKTKLCMPSGRMMPTVSGRLMRSTPAADMALHTSSKNSGSARLPSSTVNLILRPRDFAYSTVSRARSSASSRDMRSLSSRWMSDTPRYAATHCAPHDADTSMSSRNARPCATMSARSPCFSMSETARRWSSDMIGEISIWSTPK